MADMERTKYKFLFRGAGMEPVIVVHYTRPGDAENCARKMAKLVAKREHVDEVECVWMGPEELRIPQKILDEIRKELTA